MIRLKKSVKQGLERETIRIDKKGRLSLAAHPKEFGAPLTHPNITLDYSESQMEFITPPLFSENELKVFLDKIYAWASQHAGREYLWPLSMPPELPAHKDIPIARFGRSSDALQKHIYREGLKLRYGGALQTISGIHYNFSLTDSFWSEYAKEQGFRGELSLFKDMAYFRLMRNAIRNAPLLIYLFGASPVADKSFFSKTPFSLQKLDSSTYFGRFATSLRVSDFGYRNKKQDSMHISYNSLPEYLNDLYRAITTPSAMWSSIGIYRGERQVQLNANILQLENELYAPIRPKHKHDVKKGSVVYSLASGGVEYVELRIPDIDPYEPAGIGLVQLRFLKTFMLYCLLSPSPQFGKGEQKYLAENQSAVALFGRKPGLLVRVGNRKLDFSEWSLGVLREISKIAKSLDKEYKTSAYSEAINLQREKILYPEMTPSARILDDIKASGKSFAQCGLALAEDYKSKQFAVRLGAEYNRKMSKLAEESFADVKRIEMRNDWILKGYERLELSTQIIIRAAQKRGIEAKVLDDELNVVELKRGNKIEVVKQATITSHDSYLSYEIMKDKALTKLFLRNAGIATPQGGRFQGVKDAMDFGKKHRGTLVVKPATANFGIGVSIVNGRGGACERAVRRAINYDGTVVVEEFIPGKEYRFLVIAGKVIAVLNREPANVVGDGRHTIKELVKLKNSDSKSYKLPDSQIKLGAAEKELLAELRLSIDSIPPKGKKVYLRRNSNIHSGGDPIAIDNMPEYYKKIAIKAAATVGANICGVDMIIRNLKLRPGKRAYSIIELNWNPAIFMHAYPYKGKPRDVGGAVLDFLGF